MNLYRLADSSIANFSLRKVFIISFAFFFTVWGASWSLPIIKIPYSFVWIGFTLVSLVFFNQYRIKIKDLLVFGLIGASLSFFLILGMPDNLSSDRVSADVMYLVTYYLKFIFGFLVFFSFINVFKDETDIRLFLLTCALFIICIVPFLAWKYLVVYDLDYIGVVVDDAIGGIKLYKNSLATSLVFITPFLFAACYTEKNTRFIFLLSLFLVLFFLYYVNSRSALIILGFEFLIFLFLSRSKVIKKGIKITSIFLILVLVIGGFSINDWFRKSGSYSDSGIKDIATESLLQTHRGWLLIEALEGSINTAGLGNGLSTFRIRPTNEGSRTDTHNDYSLLLYEQGLIGFSLIIYLIMWRVFLSIKLSKEIDNRYLEASTSSLIGLFVSLIFVNIIQTSIFWALIAINFSIFKIYKR